MLAENELTLLGNKYAVQFQQLGKLMKAKKDIEKQEKAIKDELTEIFMKYGIEKFSNDHVVMTYVKPSETKTVDLKAFQDAEPVEYAQLLVDYPKVTKRKGYIKFTEPK